MSAAPRGSELAQGRRMIKRNAVMDVCMRQGPNENKMSCHERERARQRVKGVWSRKTRSYGGSWSAPSHG